MPLLLALLIILCASPVQADMSHTAVPIVEGYGQISSEHVRLLQPGPTDITANLSKLDQHAWSTSTGSLLNSDQKVTWLRIDLRIPSPAQGSTLEPVVFRINNFYSRHSSLYVVQGQQLLQLTPFGSDIPLSERQIKTPATVIPLNLTEGGDYTLLIRTEDKILQRILLDMWVEPERQLSFIDIPRTTAFASIFLGTFATFMLFTLILLVWRFRIEFAYACVLLFGASWTIILREGLLYQIFGWYGAWWEEHVVVAAMSCTLASTILYLRERLKPLNQYLNAYLSVSGWALLVLSVITLFFNFFDVESPAGMLYLNSHIAILALVLIACWRAVHGTGRQQIFAAVWAMFAVVIVGRLLRVQFGDIPLSTRMLWNICFAIVSAWIFFEYLLEVTQDELQRRDIQSAADSRIEMVNRLSHEIRTPLNAVIGLAELLRTQRDPAVTHNYAGMIRSAGQNLLHLVNDILDFSKLGEKNASTNREPFRVDRAITDVITNFLPQLNETDILPKILIDADIEYFLLGDAVRFKQIFSNLIGNAIKFSPIGGTIAVNIHRGDVNNDRIQLVCEVKDDGRGIPADKLEAVFEPYVQTEASDNTRLKGTGLGLAITRLLVENMGGSISASSVEGNGTTFAFDIWLDIDKDAPDPSELFQPLNNKHVALVSNIPPLFAQLRETLPYFGVILKQYQTIEELLQDSASYDVIITDSITALTHLHLDLLSNELANDTVVIIERDPKNWLDAAKLPHITTIQLPQPILTIIADIASALGASDISLPDETYQDAEYLELEHHILVVDDNALNLMVCAKLLESLNVSSVNAQGGEEALKLLEKENFSLLLLDCEMPDIDGYQVARAIRIKERDKNTLPLPIIALTAHSPSDVQERCLTSGMNEVIHKPISRQALAEVISRYPAKMKILSAADNPVTTE